MLQSILIGVGVWCVLAVILAPLVGACIKHGSRPFLVVASLAVAMPVCAQDTPHPITDRLAYSALVGGAVADLVTTQQAFTRGAVEANPLMGMTLPRIALTKAISIGAAVVAMRLLQTHGHAKAAEVIGFLGGASGFSAAAHNVRVR